MSDSLLREYQRLLVDADDTALRQGFPYGLCDATDNDGRPYPSAWAAELIDRARREIVDYPAIGRAAPPTPTER